MGALSVAATTDAYLPASRPGNGARQAFYREDPGHPEALATLNKTGQIAVFPNAAGTLGAPANATAGGHPVGLAVADLDGDKREDVVVVDADTGNVLVLLGLGDGSFAPPLAYLAGPQPVAVAIGDFDRDAKPDLAVALSAGNVAILRNIR